MVDIERGQSDLDPYSPSMGGFHGKIRNCHDVTMARYRVQSVLANYNQMRLDMPKTIQLKVARFLSLVGCGGYLAIPPARPAHRRRNVTVLGAEIP
ncbi:hypothetical protein FGADI_1514 [Fusarium gaditjirri]|uniref:Uncharacterized protein n=1 Tax=Fusarium gaditjirri TaxID=282569 RepID=A0A8H4TKL9_9HYPO|nr:hypothetical protein FGADI_1514 [Fusarium gaditjirri]